jgi:hypothetical protein
VLPVALVVVSPAAAASGHPRAAFYLLVLAVPAAAAAALELLGELLDAHPGDPARVVVGVELALGVAGLALLVGAAALRDGTGAVSSTSATALGACAALFVAQALVSLVVPAPRAAAEPL